MTAKLYAGASFRLDTRTFDIGDLFTSGTVVRQTTSVYRVEKSPGTYTDFIGTFRYTSTGDVLDGTIRQIKHVSSGLFGFIASDIYIGASDLATYPEAYKGTEFLHFGGAEPAPAIYKGSNKNDVFLPVNTLGGNFMDGKGGADIMKANGSSNRFVVDVAADRVICSGGGFSGNGFDGPNMIYAKASYALRAESSGITVLKAITATATTAMNLYGNDDTNTVIGNNGHNYLRGFDGDDKLLGLGGNDVLIGGAGKNQLIGGAGNDAFVFESSLGPTNVDHIRDFNVADDHIRLENSVFTALTTTGVLDASAFAIGPAATTPDQHIIYDPAAGRLSYDADGSGAGEAVLFATLSRNLPLTNVDFLVI